MEIYGSRETELRFVKLLYFHPFANDIWPLARKINPPLDRDPVLAARLRCQSW